MVGLDVSPTLKLQARTLTQHVHYQYLLVFVSFLVHGNREYVLASVMQQDSVIGNLDKGWRARQDASDDDDDSHTSN